MRSDGRLRPCHTPMSHSRRETETCPDLGCDMSRVMSQVEVETHTRETISLWCLTSAAPAERTNTKTPGRRRGFGRLTSATKVSCVQDTIHRRIAIVLADGPTDVKDISRKVQRPEGTIRAVLNRHPNMFTADRDSRPQLWSFVGDVSELRVDPPSVLMNGNVPNVVKKRKVSALSAQRAIEAFDGRCEICGTTWPGGNGWHLDHDHALEPGAPVRGVLCGRCNPGLGLFLHNPDLLLAAAEYLEERNG